MTQTAPNPKDYVVFRLPDGSYSVWRDDLEEPYTVWLRQHKCNCPHWYYRLRPSGVCKHQEIVRLKLVQGGVL